MAEEAIIESAPAPEVTAKPTVQEATTVKTEATPEVKPEKVKTEEVAATWRDKIQDKQLKSFTEKFTTEEDLAKAALQFRQKLSSAINLPGKDATEEEVKEFHKKLGVPDSSDGYKIDIPDNLPDTIDEEDLSKSVGEFKAMLHKAGASQNVAKAVVDHFFEMVRNAYDAEAKAVDKYRGEAESSLKKEWAEDYERNIEYARRATKQFGDDDFSRLLEEAKLDGVSVGNHPAFSKVFASIGRKMGEAGLHIVMTDTDKQSTEQKLDDLTRQAHDAISKRDTATADRLFKQRDQLAKQYYG